MSVASVVGQVIFSQKSGVYMPIVQSNQGDLYQEYTSTESGPTNISPDFPSLKPVLSYIITSSRIAEGVVRPSQISNMKWFFNDTELVFSNNISTNNFNGETGHFEFVSPASDDDYYKLKIVQNLVVASGLASCVIKAVATVSVGNTSDTIQFAYSIPITKGVGMQQHVTIVAGDNNFFTITEKNSSCVLKAITRLGNDEVTTGLTYRWYKQNGASWTDLAIYTQAYTVTNSNVDTMGVFKVEVYQNGNLIGQDIQTVVDASDPYDIVTGAVPADETIESVGDKVTYTPKVVKRGTSIAIDEYSTFNFVFMDSVGNIYKSLKNVASCEVTYEDCLNVGGNLAYTISTVS